MIDAEKLLPRDLAENRRKVKARLRNFRVEPLTFDLYRIVRELDDDDPDMMSVEETRVLKAVEDGLSFFFALYQRLEHLLEIPALRARENRERGLLEHRLEFAALYAMFAGASIIAQAAAVVRVSLPPEELREWPLDLANVSIEANEIRTFNNVVSRYLVDLCEKKPDRSRLITGTADFVCLTHDYFLALAERLIALRERYRDLLSVVEGRNFVMGEITVSGFQLEMREEEGLEAPVESFDEMVGNRELKETLLGVADKILLYDPRTRRNPAKALGDFARTLLLYGRPGTGKTMALRALISHLTTRARELGKPFRPVLIGGEIKDKYFGESVKNLKRKLAELGRGDRLSLVAIEDIDLMLVSRDDIGVSPAEKDILHELMNTLEGVASRDLGNALIVATTNDIQGIEGALAERLQENPVEVVGPETAEDFTALFKMKLRQALPPAQGGVAGYLELPERGSPRKPGWREIGEACLAAGFSGRPVKNISKRLMTLAGQFQIPDEVYGLDYEESLETLKSLYRKIDGRLVLAEIERYQVHSRAHERAIREKKIQARKESILNELRAGRQAEAEWKKSSFSHDG